MAYMFDESKDISLETDKDFWHVLSVDDDASVHEITKLVLSHFSFEGKKIKLSTASSAEEAIEFLKKHSDISLILLDIVMEKEDSGFDVATFLRSEQNNHSSRIIIRTGQPGTFPEEEVIQNFDIDGFAEKTDLTKNRLSTIVYSALRSYRDITSIAKCKHALEHLVHSLSSFTAINSYEELHKTLKTKLSTVLPSIYTVYLIEIDKQENIKILLSDLELHETLKTEILKSANLKQDIYQEKFSISYHKLSNESSLHLCFQHSKPCPMLTDVVKAFSNITCLVHQILEKNSN